MLVASLRGNPRLTRLLGAWGLSCVGVGAGYVALLFVTYRHLHSAWAISAVLLGQFVPAIAFGPWFGALADKHSKRLLIVSGSVLQAAAYGGLTVVDHAAPVISLALLAGIGNALQRPALRAALPGLAGDLAQTAAALFDSARWVGITVGPLVVAALLFVAGPSLPLAVSAGAFAVAAVMIATVPIEKRRAQADEPVAQGIRAGLRVAFSSPGIAALIACSAGGVIGGGLLNVSEPIYATKVLHGSGSDYAVLVACYGIGMVLATVLVARRGAVPLGLLVNRYVVALALMAIGMLGTAVVASVALAAWTFAATGYANGLLVVSETQIIFMRVPNLVQGRLFGAKDMIEGVLFLTGLVAAAPLIAATSVRVTLVGAASVCGVCAVAAVLAMARKGTAIMAPNEPVGQAGSDGERAQAVPPLIPLTPAPPQVPPR